jgi:hypothetical protein
MGTACTSARFAQSPPFGGIAEVTHRAILSGSCLAVVTRTRDVGACAVTFPDRLFFDSSACLLLILAVPILPLAGALLHNYISVSAEVLPLDRRSPRGRSSLVPGGLATIVWLAGPVKRLQHWGRPTWIECAQVGLSSWSRGGQAPLRSFHFGNVAGICLDRKA